MGNAPSRMFICNAEERTALMRVALGVEFADTVILNASVVNVYTGEILEDCPVSIKGKWIAAVGPNAASAAGESTLVLDAAGKTLVPGLIDGHTHMSFQTVETILPYLIKGGTTTIIAETMEFFPAAGYEGVSEFLDSAKNQPIKILGTAPATISISKALNGIPRAVLERLLERDEIVGLGECYWHAVLQSPEAIVPSLQSALDCGKPLEGHSAGAKGKKLAAYAAAGISSCHEPITVAEAIELLRLGFYVMLREGSIRKDLEQLSKIRQAGVDLRRVILVTDSVEPKEMVEKGYLEVAVQKAIACGFDPVSAIQMTTLNVAEHFGLDSAIGGIAPGRCADILVLPDVRTIAPEIVISNGRIVFKDGELLARPRRHHYSDSCLQSIRLKRTMKSSDFDIYVKGAPDSSVTVAPHSPREMAGVRVRIIEMVSDLVTKEFQADVFPIAGKITADLQQDIVKVAAIDCRNDAGLSFVGLIKGFGIKKGAIASSDAWDTTDIIVVGADEKDMALAVNRIRELHGGVTVCKDGKIMAELPLPIFGVLSDLDMEQLAERLESVRQAARALGVPFDDPVLSLDTLTGAAIPHLRICEEGLVNLKDGKTLTLEVH
ncbi:MAG: adenine deaminase C-terminal domain-containing protein [Syntrophobacteraceae bacterium]